MASAIITHYVVGDVEALGGGGIGLQPQGSGPCHHGFGWEPLELTPMGVLPWKGEKLQRRLPALC